ncbi:MAG: FAD:protein FMN transferase [Sulfurihydrogenibium sp.]
MRIFLLIFLLIFSISYSQEKDGKVFNLMGTYTIIDLPDDEKVYKVYRYLKEIESKLSDYIEDSEVSQINKFAGIKPIKVSPITFEVIKKSLEVCKMTNGAFDITVGAITINYKRKGLISLEKAKKLVNCKDVVLDEKNQTVFLKKRFMAIDLGGIGKGFAVQKAYEEINVDKGFIAIAGDMKVWGHSREVAIYNPLNKSILMSAKNKKDLCLSTSGNYFRKHIIGKDTDLLQVSVVYKDCTFTDAIDTGIFAMSKKEREEFLKNADFGYILLYNDGRVEFNKIVFEYLDEVQFYPF